jgi:hypothetical protein
VDGTADVVGSVGCWRAPGVLVKPPSWHVHIKLIMAGQLGIRRSASHCSMASWSAASR